MILFMYLKYSFPYYTNLGGKSLPKRCFRVVQLPLAFGSLIGGAWYTIGHDYSGLSCFKKLYDEPEHFKSDIGFVDPSRPRSRRVSLSGPTLSRSPYLLSATSITCNGAKSSSDYERIISVY